MGYYRLLHIIKFTQREVDRKVSTEEVQKLKDIQVRQDEVKELEADCKDVRQVIMKGNLFLNSPHSSQATSLLLPKDTTNPITWVRRKEVCTRAIFTKAGVRVPDQNIQNCHSLGHLDASPNTSYIVRFFNMKPGSAWDVLVVDLLTGCNKDAKETFDSSIPLFINFQFSKSKSHLAKMVRDAKKARRSAKYDVDQNVRVTVKVSHDSNTWREVPSEEKLTALVMAEEYLVVAGKLKNSNLVKCKTFRYNILKQRGQTLKHL